VSVEIWRELITAYANVMTAAKLLSVVNSTGQYKTMTTSGGMSVGMKRRLRIYYTEAKKALM
jgi:hypothetical protein